MAHGVDPILTVIVLQAVKKLHHRLLASEFVRPSVTLCILALRVGLRLRG